ncbi:MAG: Clp protease ClpP [Clostridiales bacterium]|nr:Clp protease ClpP [Clostridiales bacterium]
MSERKMFKFGYDVRMEAEDTGEIMVYSSIVSWKWRPEDPEVTAKEFDAAVKKLKGAKRVNLRINSPGGSVYQAVAMRSMLVQMEAAEKHVYIEGLCASAATLLASIPGWTVHMAEGSEYMIHNPISWTLGEARDMEKEAKMLRKLEADFRQMYAKRCKKDDDTIKGWMDETSWFTAQEAVDAGFVDEVLEAQEAVACAELPQDTLSIMRDMYGALPECLHMCADKTPQGADQTPQGAGATVSNDHQGVAAGESTEHMGTKEEQGTMSSKDIKEITMEDLKAENPGLYESIMRGGSEAERQRMQEIDDLTPPGYEALALEAKEKGTSPIDFQKQVVKAQREKAAKFVDDRKAETAPSVEVAGEASDNGSSDPDAELKKAAAEIAEYAKAYRASADGGMF